MVMYDWRRCPAAIEPPSAPADYGPLATDVGTRTFGDYAPMPDVEIEGCLSTLGGSMVPLLIGAGVTWAMLKRGRR
jgi:hypothetical protein